MRYWSILDRLHDGDIIARNITIHVALFETALGAG